MAERPGLDSSERLLDFLEYFLGTLKLALFFLVFYMCVCACWFLKCVSEKGWIQFYHLSTRGLVVEYIVAIDVTRVRFPASALLPCLSVCSCSSLRVVQ